MKTTETRARNAGISTKKGEEPDGLVHFHSLSYLVNTDTFLLQPTFPVQLDGDRRLWPYQVIVQHQT